MKRLSETFGNVEQTIISNEKERKCINEEKEVNKKKFKDQVMARISAKKKAQINNAELEKALLDETLTSELSKVDIAKL